MCWYYSKSSRRDTIIVNCQLSIVNCQFGEAAKQQFIAPLVLGILYLHIFPFGAILEQLPDGGPFPGEAL